MTSFKSITIWALSPLERYFTHQEIDEKIQGYNTSLNAVKDNPNALYPDLPQNMDMAGSGGNIANDSPRDKSSQIAKEYFEKIETFDQKIQRKKERIKAHLFSGKSGVYFLRFFEACTLITATASLALSLTSTIKEEDNSAADYEFWAWSTGLLTSLTGLAWYLYAKNEADYKALEQHKPANKFTLENAREFIREWETARACKDPEKRHKKLVRALETLGTIPKDRFDLLIKRDDYVCVLIDKTLEPTDPLRLALINIFLDNSTGSLSASQMPSPSPEKLKSSSQSFQEEEEEGGFSTAYNEGSPIRAASNQKIMLLESNPENLTAIPGTAVPGLNSGIEMLPLGMGSDSENEHMDTAVDTAIKMPLRDFTKEFLDMIPFEMSRIRYKNDVRVLRPEAQDTSSRIEVIVQ